MKKPEYQPTKKTDQPDFTLLQNKEGQESENLNQGNKSQKELLTPILNWLGIAGGAITIVGTTAVLAVSWQTRANEIALINKSLVEINENLKTNQQLVTQMNEKVNGIDLRVKDVEAKFELLLHFIPFNLYKRTLPEKPKPSGG